MFKLPEFQAPDFADEKYVSMPCVITEKVEKDVCLIIQDFLK